MIFDLFVRLYQALLTFSGTDTHRGESIYRLDPVPAGGRHLVRQLADPQGVRMLRTKVLADGRGA
jgi:hypothetical protein